MFRPDVGAQIGGKYSNRGQIQCQNIQSEQLPQYAGLLPLLRQNQILKMYGFFASTVLYP